MGPNTEQTTRKALTYVICLDLIKSAIENLGTVNTADHSKTDMIVFDSLVDATKAQQAKE